MQILVINAGSSSIKFSVFGAEDGSDPKAIADGELSGIGTSGAQLNLRGADGRDLAPGKAAAGIKQLGGASMEEALATVEDALKSAGLPGADAVGYRVVHPGPRMKGHQRITGEVLQELKGAVRFAPLHDPVAIALIEEMMRRMPGVPHFACFDTVFHEGMPETARTYALPQQVRDEGVRRYGFHGLSCESVCMELLGASGAEVPRSFVIAHLGSGCSVTSVVDGRSVRNTMGLTPTGGVVMGTRPGDLDPGVVLYLLRRAGATTDAVEAMLNHDCGLKALGGVNDMRELRRRAAMGDGDGAAARDATAVFTESVARAIAAEVVLNDAEAVVFTGGIGEHDAASRAEISARLESLGIVVDDQSNRAGLGDGATTRISAKGSKVEVWVARSDEDRMIARIVRGMCSGQRSREHPPA